MARHNQSRITLREDDVSLANQPDPTLAEPMSVEQLQRWAVLIANGEAAFPQLAVPIDVQWLMEAVREHRRRRLIQCIARAIAHDLWPRARSDKERS